MLSFCDILNKNIRYFKQK